MALSCLDEANWSENIYLGVTLSRQRQVVDLKAITFEQHQLLGRYRTAFCSKNYSATIKVSPPSRPHQRLLCSSLRDLWAQKVILRRYKDSVAACKPVLGASLTHWRAHKTVLYTNPSNKGHIEGDWAMWMMATVANSWFNQVPQFALRLKCVWPQWPESPSQLQTIKLHQQHPHRLQSDVWVLQIKEGS